MLEKYPNIYVVADEIYEHINFDEKHFSIGYRIDREKTWLMVFWDWLESWFYWSQW